METVDRIDAALAALKLTVSSEFVPFSKSRNAREKRPSLNWRVTLKRDGRDVLACDYSAGEAHAPSYEQRASADSAAAVKAECEHGVSFRGGLPSRNRPILPNPRDVIHSLLLDGDAIEHPTYESWASDFGYDVDSRKGEATYRPCLEIGLKLRAAIGDAGLTELRAAFEGY